MKVRELGKAILDFDLGKVLQLFLALIELCLSSVWVLFCGLVKLYRILWLPIILACAATVYFNLEAACTEFCDYALNLGDSYSIDKAILAPVMLAIVGIFIAIGLEQKLKRLNAENA